MKGRFFLFVGLFLANSLSAAQNTGWLDLIANGVDNHNEVCYLSLFFAAKSVITPDPVTICVGCCFCCCALYPYCKVAKGFYDNHRELQRRLAAAAAVPINAQPFFRNYGPSSEQVCTQR